MNIPIEISQLFGCTARQDSGIFSRRYMVANIVDMAMKNLQQLPSWQTAENMCENTTRDQKDSLEYQLEYLRTIDGYTVHTIKRLMQKQRTNSTWSIFNLIHLLGCLMYLLFKSSPNLIRSPIDYVFFFLTIPHAVVRAIAMYIEALIKIAACWMTDLFTWSTDTILGKAHYCFKLFVALPILALSLPLFCVGQLFYLVANNLSYLRFALDAIVNLPLSLISFCCCGDKHPDGHTCFNSLIKHILLLAPTAAIPVAILFIPFVNVLVMPYITAAAAILLAQPLVLTAEFAIVSVTVFGAATTLAIASQTISGLIRGTWDAIEGFCLRCCCSTPKNDGYEGLARNPNFDSSYEARPNPRNRVASAVELPNQSTRPGSTQPLPQQGQSSSSSSSAVRR